jgi:hypothetical protein
MYLFQPYLLFVCKLHPKTLIESAHEMTDRLVLNVFGVDDVVRQGVV